MTTGVERGPHLDREGIRTDRAKWNLSAAALYEEAMRNQEGVIAAEGPLVCRTGQHTGRSPERQVHRARALERGEDRLGQAEPAHGSGAVGCAAPGFHRVAAGQSAVRARLLRRRRSDVPSAGPHHQRVRLAQPVLPQPVHRRSAAAAAAQSPEFTVIDRRASRPIPKRHGTQHRSGDRAELREEARAHRRHQLRRRDEEVDLQRAELRPPAQERALDALLGQHRARRATRRSSSACPAPARRRSRAIPIAS